MNKSLIKNIFFVAITAVTLATLFSSCQRGYGCPYKFQAKTEIKK